MQVGRERTLPLEALHTSLGARFGEFAGWRMPLWFGGALQEHLAVRRAAGVFDISHMGRFRVRGRDAGALLSSVFSRDATLLALGASVYTLACNDTGGIIDDLLLYRTAEESFVVICNAANAGHIAAFLYGAAQAGREAAIEDLQLDTVFLAIQGPQAAERAGRALSAELLSVPRHGCREVAAGGQVYFCGRTGYTGEDGFEVMAPVAPGGDLFRRLIESESCTPCGLAARDSLRLEAALPLHGADIDESTSPWEAGLGWAVELDHDFVGREALEATKGSGTRRLACIVSDGAGVFRHGQPVYDGDVLLGALSSGGFSPMLNRGIALAYLPRSLAREGTALAVDVRGRRVTCHVVKRPFYSSPKVAE